MNTNMTFVVLACAISGASTLLDIEQAAAQEQTIGCDDVPNAVRMAFQKVYPKATIQGCAKEVEAARTAYEISSIEGKTRRDILYYEDGTLIIVEEAIDAADLPKPVQQAVGEALADHTIELVEKLIRDDTVTFEIQSKHGDVALEIVFDGTGKVLKIAAAGAEEPPAGATTKQHEKNQTDGEGEEGEE
jgi:hypothetical protein